MNDMFFDMERENENNSRKSREDLFNELTASEEEFLRRRKRHFRSDEEGLVWEAQRRGRK